MLVGDTLAVPSMDFGPVQAPLARHESAFVLDQVSVEAPPAVMVLAPAVIFAVGAGVAASTFTFVADCAVPPDPAQARE